MNRKIFLNISFKIYVSLLAAAFLFTGINTLKASDEKDLILVLDTSLTMAGYGAGGKNILPQVKKSLPQFIEQLNKNDSITLITFDSDIKIYPTIYISNKKNKESLIEYINNINATGQWTYTSEMMKTAFRKAKELEEKDKDRQQVIIAMTDAIDDPPPGKRADKLNIKDIGKNYKDKDWFIFFVNFGEALKNNPKLASMQKELKTNITKYTNVIDTQTGPGKPGEKKAGSLAQKNGEKYAQKDIKTAIEKDLSQNIKEMRERRIEKGWSFPFRYLIIALIVIAAIAAGIYYYKVNSGVKVAGNLEYWEHTMLTPSFEKFDLTNQNSKEILIGVKNSYNLTIRDLEITDPLKIIAIRSAGEVKSTLQAGRGYDIEYVNREPGGYLKSGDMFKVANYTFKYTSA